MISFYYTRLRLRLSLELVDLQNSADENYVSKIPHGPAGLCCTEDGFEPVMMISLPMFVFLLCQCAYVCYEHVWLSVTSILAVQARTRQC